MDKEHIDLAVLDVMMPKMDGYQFTESLRDCENDLPILMVSAKQMPEDKRKAFLVGTDDYMTKPIDEVELLLRIKALLRRAKIATERRIVIGDITLDYDNFTVNRGEESHVLPQKEFLLLYKLLSYPGQIFTRIQLMDEIWGADSETGWETVTVHIARLRKRFDAYDQRYTTLARTLQTFGNELYENGYTNEARTVLEFAVSTHTDISSTYKLLCKIYKEQNQPQKINELLPIAKELNSGLKNSIVQMLMEECL